MIGDLCVQYGVTVVSDEIHGDFIFKGEHQVFAGIKKEYEDITITCTAPSKTFNLASMMMSNIFIANPELRAKFQKQARCCRNEPAWRDGSCGLPDSVQQGRRVV